MQGEVSVKDLRRICDLPMDLAVEAEAVLKRLQTALDDAAAQLSVRNMDTTRLDVAAAEVKQTGYHVSKVQENIRSAAGVT